MSGVMRVYILNVTFLVKATAYITINGGYPDVSPVITLVVDDPSLGPLDRTNSDTVLVSIEPCAASCSDWLFDILYNL